MTTPDPIDTKARECAKEVFVAQERYCATNHKTLADTEVLIAAALREATEPLKLELGALHGRIGLFAAKWYLISDNLPTDETFAQMEEQIADAANKYLALMAERDRLRAALDVAEGALKQAKPYVTWSDNEGRQESDYPEASAIVKADKECVEQALARIAAIKEGKP